MFCLVKRAKNKSLAAVQSFERPKFDSLRTPKNPAAPEVLCSGTLERKPWHNTSHTARDHQLVKEGKHLCPLLTRLPTPLSPPNIPGKCNHTSKEIPQVKTQIIRQDAADSNHHRPQNLTLVQLLQNTAQIVRSPVHRPSRLKTFNSKCTPRPKRTLNTYFLFMALTTFNVVISYTV